MNEDKIDQLANEFGAKLARGVNSDEELVEAVEQAIEVLKGFVEAAKEMLS